MCGLVVKQVMAYGIHVTDNVEPVSAEGFLGVQVRAAREARGWSQEVLAARLLKHTGVKLGQSGVVRLEKGHRPTRLNEAVDIARFLSIDLTPLLKTPTEEQISAARAELLDAEARRDAAAARLQGLFAAVGAAAERLKAIGAEARAFDRADPATLKTGARVATLPDGGEVRVRALTPDEVEHVKTLQDLAAKEAYIVAAGMTEPKLSEADATRWASQSVAGDVGAVLRAIAELSGVMGDDSDGER